MQLDPVMRELERIRKRHDGVLHPRDVVSFARDPKTALHDRFEWSDSKAAAAFRLDQARHIIRLHVTVVSEKTEPVRAFVSLTSDRAKGGGYRAIVDVLDDKQQTQQLVMEALTELTRLKVKYENLRALQPVWAAIGKAAAIIAPRARKAA